MLHVELCSMLTTQLFSPAAALWACSLDLKQQLFNRAMHGCGLVSRAELEKDLNLKLVCLSACLCLCLCCRLLTAPRLVLIVTVRQ